MPRITWSIRRGSRTTAYLESSTPICLFTITLLRAPMKNKGCLLMRPLMLSWNRAKIVQKMAKIWRFSGSGGQGLEKVSIFTAKGTSTPRSTSFAIFRVKIGWGCDLHVHSGKNKESNKHRIVHIFTQKPPLLRSSLNFLGADIQDVINCAKFYSNPLSGFDFVMGRILAFPIGMRCRR